MMRPSVSEEGSLGTGPWPKVTSWHCHCKKELLQNVLVHLTFLGQAGVKIGSPQMNPSDSDTWKQGT